MPGYVSFTDGVLPHDSVDQWDVAFEAIRDGKLSAGDFIGLGINVVSNNKPPSSLSVRLFRVWAAVHSGCQSGRFSGRFREQTGYSGPCRALSGSSINRPGRGPERPGLGPAEQERGRPEVPQNHIRFSYYKCAGYYMGLWVSGCFVVHPDNCSVQVRYVCQLAQYASGFLACLLTCLVAASIVVLLADVCTNHGMACAFLCVLNACFLYVSIAITCLIAETIQLTEQTVR